MRPQAPPADTSLRKSDEELVGIARAAVEKLTGGEVISATIQGMATYESEDEILIFETTLLVHIFPEEGGFYTADVRVSDGMVYMIVYKPDPAEFPNEYHW